MKLLKHSYIIFLMLVIFLIMLVIFLISCGIPNNPYPKSQENKEIYYNTFDEEPKHFDPVVSYSSDEYKFIQQIYEPPLQYHYLKRPYELIPLTAAAVPQPQYFDASGKVLPQGASAKSVARAIYEAVSYTHLTLPTKRIV